jgi:MoaA/NifB/PqqE/SkfB family radical SAM enzyme
LPDRLQQLCHQAKIVLGSRTHERAKTGPLYVQVGVSNRCNYRCQFCWDHPTFVPKDAPWPDEVTRDYYSAHPDIDRDRALMPFTMFTDLLDDLYAVNTRKIKFIGRGEPFLHPRFVEMVAYAKRKGFNCSVTTNGSLIEDEHVRELVGLGLDELYVSVNAASSQTYNELHPHTRPDAMDRIKRVLAAFSREKSRLGVNRPSVHLSCVITSRNYAEMPGMVSLAHEVDAQHVAFVRVSVYKGTEFLMLDEVQHAEALQEYLAEATRLGAQHGIATNAEIFRAQPVEVQRSRQIHTRVPCYVGWYFALVLADGTVGPCCECLKSIGTLQKQRFRDIWFGEQYRRFRRTITHLPALGKEIEGCRCYNCGLALHNLSMHRVVHPLSGISRDIPTYGLRELLRFVSG